MPLLSSVSRPAQKSRNLTEPNVWPALSQKTSEALSNPGILTPLWIWKWYRYPIATLRGLISPPHGFLASGLQEPQNCFERVSYSPSHFIHRDMQPLLNALPSVGTFDPGFRSPGTQVANTSHQPPSRIQSSSSPWLPQQPHFTALATLPSMQQSLPVPAQRSSAETSELRAALLKIFPDSEQKLKIDQILVAHPYMKDLNALSALVLD